MSEETKDNTVTIDENTYEFYHIGLMKKNEIMMRTMAMIGPSFSKQVSVTDDSVAMAEIIGSLCASLDTVKVNALINDVLEQTSCVGKGRVKGNMDKIIPDLKHMWQLVIEAYKYYYQSFFQGGLSSMINQITGTVNGEHETQPLA